MKIAFFGASVTEQKYATGYVPVLESLVKSQGQKIIQKGYGGTHLKDAGLCFIDEVIAETPQLCFLDWFSTDFIMSDLEEVKKYLNPIVRKLMEIQCGIVLLLFDRTDLCEKRIHMYKILKRQAQNFSIDTISAQSNPDVQNLLRDYVHTGPKGALLYANRINDQLKMKSNTNFYVKYTYMPPKNIFSDVRCLPFQKSISKTLILKGKFQLIGLYIEMGPFCGLIQKTQDGTIIRTEQLWDRWCNQKRYTIRFNTNELTNEIRFDILQDLFDTSECKDDFDFKKYTKKLQCERIQYCGDLSVSFSE